MAESYNPNSSLYLSALQKLAVRTDTRLDALEAAGGQANVLEGVKVNGTALAIADKMVDILIATGVTNGTFKANGVEVSIAGLADMAYKANVSESDLAEALATKLNGKADAASVYTRQQIDGIISSVYKPAGSVAFASLPALAAGVLGNVYNVTDAFTTTADFVEGAGKKHSAGTNVVVVNTGDAETPEYKFDVLAGFVDLSGYVEKNGTDRLMTAAEGTKLGGIAEGATKVEASETNGNVKINGSETTVYTHPTATAATAAFVKVGSDAAGHVVVGDAITKNDITALGIPAQDTTYTPATTSANGLMSAADKTKLDGITFATDAEVDAMLDEVFGASST